MIQKIISIITLFVFLYSLLFSDPPDWAPITGTEHSMVLISQIMYEGMYFIGGGNLNMAGAFGPGGETDCRSVAVWQEPYPPYWDGYWYFTIVGDINGESISFKIYNEDNDSLYDCYETISFENNATIGDPYDPYELSVIPVGVDALNYNKLNFKAYPNPFCNTATFSMISHHDHFEELSIFDVKGRLINFFPLDHYHNLHSITWSAKDLSGNTVTPGIYLYKLKTRNTSIHGKIIYIPG